MNNESGISEQEEKKVGVTETRFKNPSGEVVEVITEEQWELAKSVPGGIDGILKRNGINPDEVIEGWRRGFQDPLFDAAFVAWLNIQKFNVKAVQENPIQAIAEWLASAKTVKQWRESDLESLDELVPGFVLKHGLTLVAGAPKSGKTTFARCIAHAVAAGVPFLGRDVVQGEVLYLLLDDDGGYVAKTIDAINGKAEAREFIYERGIRSAHGAEENDSVKLLMVDRAAALANPDPAGMDDLPLIVTPRHGFHKSLYVESLAAWLVLKRQTKLIVIDTLGKLLPVENGNDYTPMQNALDSIAAFASKARVAVLFIHHTNKSESDDLVQRLLGSQAVAGAVDIPIVLDKLDNGNSGLGMVDVLSRRGPRFQLTYKLDLYKMSVSLVTSKTRAAEAAEKKSAELTALAETLPADGSTVAAKDCWRAQGIEDRHVRADRKRELQKAGLAFFEGSKGKGDQVRRAVGGETYTTH